MTTHETEPDITGLEAIELASDLSRQFTAQTVAAHVAKIMTGRHLYTDKDMNGILNLCLDLMGETYIVGEVRE